MCTHNQKTALPRFVFYKPTSTQKESAACPCNRQSLLGLSTSHCTAPPCGTACTPTCAGLCCAVLVTCRAVWTWEASADGTGLTKAFADDESTASMVTQRLITADLPEAIVSVCRASLSTREGKVATSRDHSKCPFTTGCIFSSHDLLFPREIIIHSGSRGFLNPQLHDLS